MNEAVLRRFREVKSAIRQTCAPKIDEKSTEPVDWATYSYVTMMMAQGIVASCKAMSREIKAAVSSGGEGDEDE